MINRKRRNLPSNKITNREEGSYIKNTPVSDTRWATTQGSWIIDRVRSLNL